MKELMLEIISELLKMSIPELETVKKERLSELETKGVSEPLVKLCQAAVDLAIEKKREKGRCSGMNMEFKETGVVEMLKYQDYAPYYNCQGIDELLRHEPFSVTRSMAQSLFMLGYIQGKRAERAKRK